jgi:hypothetical protein
MKFWPDCLDLRKPNRRVEQSDHRELEPKKIVIETQLVLVLKFW